MLNFYNKLKYTFAFDGDNAGLKNLIIPDLTTSIRFGYDYLEENGILINYIVDPIKTPEDVSYELYGSIEYYWVILSINKIFDVHTEWYMSEYKLREFCFEKYGESAFEPTYIVDNKNNIIGSYDTYRIDDDNSIIDLTLRQRQDGYTGPVYVWTNYDYEYEINERRKEIKVVKPEYVRSVLENFISALK